MIVCGICGSQNEATARYCGNCGNVLPGGGAGQGQSGAEPSIQPRQPSRQARPGPTTPRVGQQQARDSTETVPVTSQASQSGTGVAATLEPATVRVEPGGNALVSVRVVNLSRVVDEFSVEVIGEVAAWSQVVPSSVSLFPAATGTVEIQVRPPRTRAATAGALPLGIRVRSVADTTKQVYAQGLVEVGVFEEISASLVPRTSNGTLSATHELTVENHGNRVVRLDITASDPDQVLTFAVSPTTTQLRPGEMVVSRIRVQASRQKLRGTPETRPFQVSANPDIGQRIAVDANFTQRPVLPPWIGKAALAAVAVVGVLVAGLLFVRGPQPPPSNPPNGTAVAGQTQPVDTPTRTSTGGGGGGQGGGGGGGQGGGNSPTPVADAVPSLPTPSPTPTPSPSPEPTPDPELVVWDLIGGQFDSAPTISTRGTGLLDVFGRGTDNTVYRAWSEGAGWQCCEQIGPNAVQFKPASISSAPGRIDVFAVGTDGMMYRQVWEGAWSGWTSIGGSFTSGPAATSWGFGRLDVFGRGQDGTLYHAWTDDGTSWFPWEQLGSDQIEGPPAAVARGVGRIDVFSEGTDGQVYQQSYDGTTWSGWRPVGGLGSVTSAPAVTFWAPERLDLFVRGEGRALFHASSEDGFTWSPWERLGSNQITSDPAAVAWAPGRLDVVTRGIEDAFQHRWYDGTWQP